MSDLGARPTGSGLSVADEATWLRLRNVVARERGFWFGAVFVPDARGLAELQRRTSSFVTGSGREQRVRVARQPDDLREIVVELLAAEPGTAGLWWIVATGSLADGDGEPSDWYSAWVSAVTALNRRRDAMRATLQGGLMLVGPPGLLRILATRAVDLWSVRTFTAELTGAAPVPGRMAGRLEFVGERSSATDPADTSLDALTLSDEVTARVRSIDALLTRGEAGAALAEAAELVSDNEDDHERIAGLELVARARAAMHYYETAADAAVDVVERRSALLGPDHPDTLTTRGNLADWLGQSGRVNDAITQFQTLLTDRIRILGPDHPDTLTTRNNLARWLGESGRVDDAITQFQTLLTDRIRILGPDHPNTLTTRRALAHWEAQAAQ